MRTRFLSLLAILALTFTVSGCGHGPVTGHQGADPAKSVVTVMVKDMKFTPARVTIEPGQAVTWKFDDGNVRHDVQADDGSFGSEVAVSGTYTHVFEKAGTFGYDCSLHPTMTGQVTVRK